MEKAKGVSGREVGVDSVGGCGWRSRDGFSARYEELGSGIMEKLVVFLSPRMEWGCGTLIELRSTKFDQNVSNIGSVNTCTTIIVPDSHYA